MNISNNDEISKIIKSIQSARKRNSIALGTSKEDLKRYGEFYQDENENITDHTGTDLPKIILGIKELPKGKATGLTGIPNCWPFIPLVLY